MDSEGIANSIGAQFVTAWHAPIPFLAAVVGMSFVIWWLVKREFVIRLANADSTITMLKERLDRFQSADAVALAAADLAPQTIEPPLPVLVADAAITEENDTLSSNATISEREFADANITPQFLMGLMDGRTEYLAMKLIEPSLDKWMHIAGKISSVTASGAVVVAVEKVRVMCFFDSDEGFDRLQNSDHIHIIGQLHKVNVLGLQVAHCEIVPPVVHQLTASAQSAPIASLEMKVIRAKPNGND